MPRFLTSACVMSRIMPAFCSSVRPAAMLTVISGIVVSSLLFFSSWPGVSRPSTIIAIKQDVDARDKPGHDAFNEWLSPLYVMALQHFAHGIDELALVDLVLCLGLFLQILFAVLDLGKPRSKDEILDLDLAIRPFVRPLYDRAGRVSPVGIFHLLANAVFWISMIQLGADIRVA